MSEQVRAQSKGMATCPVCGVSQPAFFLNSHLDRCLQAGEAQDQDQAQASSKHATSFSFAAAAQPSSSPDDRPVGAVEDKPPQPSPVSRPGPSLKRSFTAISRTDQTGPRPSKRPIPSPTPAGGSSTVAATTRDHIASAAPLAERMRPRTLDDFVGQEKLVGKGSLLRSLIQRDHVGSIVFWGPPGTGKTTLARIIASRTRAHFRELSATSAATADLRKVFEEAQNRLLLGGQKTILFIDEIQRFNKGVQDLFLPYVERGSIQMIAATTENPSFRLNGALLSRMRVFVLDKLSVRDCHKVLRRAADRCGHPVVPSPDGGGDGDGGDVDVVSRAGEREEAAVGVKLEENEPLSPAVAPNSLLSPVQRGGNGWTVPSTALGKPKAKAKEEEKEEEGAELARVDDELLFWLATMADGDARTALNALELALSAVEDGSLPPTRRALKEALRRSALQYDRTGDMHYDTISALHKSIRGSDPDAALYWLARMLGGGDDPLYIARRLLRAASEDINTPDAINLAVNTYQTCQLLGMPECDTALASCVVYLAEAPKSVRVYKALRRAQAAVAEEFNFPVPLHIRNAPTKLMKELGYAQEYRYEPSYAHPIYQEFFPPELRGTRFLSPPPEPGPGPGPISLPSSSSEAETKTKEDGAVYTSSHVAAPDGSAQSTGSSNVPAAALDATLGQGPGCCKRVFEPTARIVDEALLREWEVRRNGASPWSGRAALGLGLGVGEARPGGGREDKDEGGGC